MDSHNEVVSPDRYYAYYRHTAYSMRIQADRCRWTLTRTTYLIALRLICFIVTGNACIDLLQYLPCSV